MQKGYKVDELRQRLLTQAFLYDSPEAYTAGVEAALRAVQRLPRDADETVQAAPRPPARRSAS